MANEFAAYCGLDCEACKYLESRGCPGCPATQGKPFWGECEVAVCCLAKGYEHCGQCPEVPCATLNSFSYGEGEDYDNGERIRNCQAWQAEGYEVWRAKRGTV